MGENIQEDIGRKKEIFNPFKSVAEACHSLLFDLIPGYI